LIIDDCFAKWVPFVLKSMNLASSRSKQKTQFTEKDIYLFFAQICILMYFGLSPTDFYDDPYGWHRSGALPQWKYQQMWNLFHPFNAGYYQYDASNHEQWYSSKENYASFKPMMEIVQNILMGYSFNANTDDSTLITIDDDVMGSSARNKVEEEMDSDTVSIKEKHAKGSVIHSMGNSYTGLQYGFCLAWRSASVWQIIDDLLRSLVRDRNVRDNVRCTTPKGR
jgi:hypothetical protein